MTENGSRSLTPKSRERKVKSDPFDDSVQVIKVGVGIWDWNGNQSLEWEYGIGMGISD